MFNSSALGANYTAEKKWPGVVWCPGLFVLTFCFSNASLLIMQMTYKAPV